MEKCCICVKPVIKRHRSNIYCSDICKKKAGKISRDRSNKFKKQFETHAEYLLAMLEIAKKTITETHHLTPTGFNQVCEFSYRSYTNIFRGLAWVEILDKFGYGQHLKRYISDEFKMHIKSTGKSDFQAFCNKHQYITYEIAQSIGIDYFYEEASVQKKRYSLQELEKNFKDVYCYYNVIPLYKEFIDRTCISISSYKHHLQLTGEIYIGILSYYCSEHEIENYRERIKEYKSNLGKITVGLSEKYTIEDFDKEFKRVITTVDERYGGYITKRLFDKLFCFSERTFRKKLGLNTWTEICTHYGRKTGGRNVSELAALNLLSTITGYSFEGQKKFEWLLNENGNKMRCDGYFHELELVVEFDGAQHRIPLKHHGGLKSFLKVVERDMIRNVCIPQKGLLLMRIDSRDNWEREEYMIKKLNGLGIYKDIHY
ncbi:hypothetical protein [Psychrobacillus psychrodurans]|uniref:Uncharacterized protein n=1 Tax=Psychrobacillus psychrodurans TaxID=126157 RepID=A0A9X3L8J3_9BACI|nr:hypothetical protein [Psychrobacillus psychrodurans]MCZ8533377.1 hypothetical protein [Psychrobacillus psychrodurans]